MLLISLARPFIIHKPPRLDFDTMLSSIATLSQSPLPSCPHSWLPCTNPFYFTLASLRFLSLPVFSPPLFYPSAPPSSFPLSPTASIYVYDIPIQLLYRPVQHYIQLYRLCYPRRCLWRNHNRCLHSCHAWRNNKCRVARGQPSQTNVEPTWNTSSQHPSNTTLQI